MKLSKENIEFQKPPAEKSRKIDRQETKTLRKYGREDVYDPGVEENIQVLKTINA